MGVGLFRVVPPTGLGATGRYAWTRCLRLRPAESDDAVTARAAGRVQSPSRRSCFAGDPDCCDSRLGQMEGVSVTGR